MNKTRTILIALNLLSNVSALRGQGTFRNLDFGMSQVPEFTPPDTLVSASVAFPFWSTYLGTNQISSVLFNSETIGSANISLLDSHSPVGAVIPGYNTAVLQAGYVSSVVVPASIAQTGQIPSDAMSLLFVASAPSLSGWQVTIGDIKIPVVEVAPVTSFFNEYAANISLFAGETAELRFTAVGGPSPSNMFMGDIQFSSLAVPEPSTDTLVVFGGLVLGLRMLRRRT